MSYQQGFLAIGVAALLSASNMAQAPKTIDQLTGTIDDVKASNDPAKMRAALDQVQKPLADMKGHMNGCMSMMSMMEKMHQK